MTIVLWTFSPPEFIYRRWYLEVRPLGDNQALSSGMDSVPYKRRPESLLPASAPGQGRTGRGPSVTWKFFTRT